MRSHSGVASAMFGALAKKKINIEDRPHIVQSSFQINQIGLIKSELRPSGSVYTPVKIVELKK